ncbi:MAG: YggT family protein [Coriobacteriia bacterium]|nr:YggT family protein [Coriobacteriia bacterium]
MSAAYIVARLIDFYVLLIFAYVILSWFRPSGALFDIYRTLALVCEPFIGVFRRILPMARVGGAGLDFSPFIAILVLQYLIRPGILMLLGTLR